MAHPVLLATQKSDWSPISHKNEMHGRASYRYFWNLLRKAYLNGGFNIEQAKSSFFNEIH